MLGKKMSSKGRMSIQSLSAQGARGSKVASPVSPDVPLVIPQIKVQESFKLLPKYSAGKYLKNKIYKENHFRF